MGHKQKPPPRMPTVFLPHGGGPWPFTNDHMLGKPMYANLSTYMRSFTRMLPCTPRAILTISAHWEEDAPTVMTHPSPPMLYDYVGFPPETYTIVWTAPGSPDLADSIQQLLCNAGFHPAANPDRGFDHGTFVPLMLAYPDAEIPTLQLSLKTGLDPAEHLALGNALAPLRDEKVLIVGSGMSYHNIGALLGNLRQTSASTPTLQDSIEFDTWLNESMLLEPNQRKKRLLEWEKAPQARSAHPREEHLMPLHVVAGAAEQDTATLPYRDVVLGAAISAVHFG
jgi:aromatic ring-opening dioxygenase catalytic subunit (LigB family)